MKYNKSAEIRLSMGMLKNIVSFHTIFFKFRAATNRKSWSTWIYTCELRGQLDLQLPNEWFSKADTAMLCDPFVISAQCTLQ